MNAAARLANQGFLGRSWSIAIYWTKGQVSSTLLLLALLTTALGIVYVTNVTRSLNGNLHLALMEKNKSHVEWGRLLLEKSTWMKQARVQEVAEMKLNMVMPDAKSIKVITLK
jgi:cell division protein FtsL